MRLPDMWFACLFELNICRFFSCMTLQITAWKAVGQILFYNLWSAVDGKNMSNMTPPVCVNENLFSIVFMGLVYSPWKPPIIYHSCRQKKIYIYIFHTYRFLIGFDMGYIFMAKDSANLVFFFRWHLQRSFARQPKRRFGAEVLLFHSGEVERQRLVWCRDPWPQPWWLASTQNITGCFFAKPKP